jgi:cell division protein FtsI (penicillin-binding protein 3)
VDCQNGAIVLAKHRIRDHKPFGTLSVAQVLQHSSDVGAIKIGLRLGERKFYDYIRAYGFGRPTGIELPGEHRGLLRQIENWSAISIGSISMGQEVGVTGLQLTAAMSAIGNGGVLYQPHILREIHRPGAAPETIVPTGQRVISPRTAAMMRRMLEGVVLEGTGRLARLNGYTAAGKTGTAQKLDPTTGTYSHSQYVASFVGIAPLNNPAISVLVVLDSPVGRHQGGEIAAPAFSRIAQQVLTYLDVPHDVPFRPPEHAKGKIEEEPLDLSDLAPSQLEVFAGEDALRAAGPSQAASAESFAMASQATGPALGEASSAETVGWSNQPSVEVPSLIGKSVREVTEECFRLGLSPVLVGNGIAAEQSLPPGAQVPAAARLTVRFAQSGKAQLQAPGKATERSGKKL